MPAPDVLPPTTLSGVMMWRGILTAIGAVNITVWLAAALLAGRGGVATDPAVRLARRRQLALSALFVFGCAFRSLFPRADVQRICLTDSWLASVAVGRSVATVAELAFVAQCALLLAGVARRAGARVLMVVARLLVPLIAVAEVFSWYAVLTTNYLGNVFEESTWTLASGLVVAGFVALWMRMGPRRPRFLLPAIFVGAAYFAFMCTVDVPTYLVRWSHDQQVGRRYLTVGEGWHDASTRWVVTDAWSEWHEEIPWMSLYFSVGVWVSIALTRLPSLDGAEAASQATASSSAQ